MVFNRLFNFLFNLSGRMMDNANAQKKYGYRSFNK